MGFDRRTARVVVQTVALTATAMALAMLVAFSDARVAVALVAAALVGQTWWLLRAATASDRATERVVAAIGAGDFSQTLAAEVGESRLASSFNAAVNRLRSLVAERDAERLALQAIVEHAPTPMIAIDTSGEAELLNAAARRLFDRARVLKRADLAAFGDELASALAELEPGERRLVRAQTGEGDLRLALSATSVTERGVRRRVIALQNIDSELGAAEFDAWRDLVRVLTHEIMNTMTPITSLTETSYELTAELASRLASDDNAPDVAEIAGDARTAAEAAYRRAAGLKAFVETYRQIARVPEPRRARVAAADLLSRVRTVFEADRPAAAIELSVRPAGLSFIADADLLEQALLNLLSNAADAQSEADSPSAIQMRAELEKSGDITLTVADAGVGVPEDIRTRIFTPFFTTKEHGSGVGLAVVRQIALAHGGRATFAVRANGGSEFGLRFPTN